MMSKLFCREAFDVPGRLHSKCSCFVGFVPQFPFSYDSFPVCDIEPGLKWKEGGNFLNGVLLIHHNPSMLLIVSAYVITLHEIIFSQWFQKPTEAKSNPSLVGAGSQSLARLGGLVLL